MHSPRPTWSRVGGILVSILLATSQVSPTLALAASSESVDKAETVHVNTDASGTVSQITVEDLLSNDSGAEELLDRSLLHDIVPSEDGQGFSQGDDGALTWTANGEQVNYEGTSDQTPPVEVSVTYRLDGSEVSPAQLAGASGHLVIRIDYKNSISSEREVDGESCTIYTPFVCMTAAILDSEVFSNIQVENGKVIDDKGGLMVIGYALPGLRESLDIDPDDFDLDLPEYVQIEADVDDLSMDPLYTIVTPELFTDLDTSDLDFGDLGEGTDELQDAMNQLIDGSGALGDALSQLTDGSGQLGKGVRALKAALGALPDGVAKLTNGAQTLSDRLGEASTVADALAQGASGLSEAAAGAQEMGQASSDQIAAAITSVSTLKSKVDALDLGSTRQATLDAADIAKGAQQSAAKAKELLDGVSSDVSTQKEAVASDINGASGQLDAATGALDSLLSDEGLGLTDEQKAALSSKVDAAKGQIAGAKDQLDGALTDLDAISSSTPEGLSDQVAALSDASGKLADKAKQISDAAGDVSAVTTGADDALTALGSAAGAASVSNQYLAGVSQGADSLSEGATGIASGLGAAATGAQSLADALDQLSGQAPQALAGIDALATGSDQLTGGISAVADGAGQLTSGLSTFNDEGISKIVDALDDLDGDLNGMTDRMDALREAAREYDSFAGKADGQSGTVRFIYKTERIG